MVNRELKPATLELVLPSDPIHNRIAEEVTLGEINSELIQGLIDRMIELSEGKGHNSSDTRQMVGVLPLLS